MLNIALGAAAALASLAGFIALRPSAFRIARTRKVAAPPDVVHAYVNDFHKWAEWSPWEKLDPALQREYSGAASGVGAGYAWSGNKQVGKGRMTITDSQPPRSVTIRLEFLEPWQATNTTQIDLAPSGTGTDVTWSMTGNNNFMAKAFGLFMNMDKLVGTDFERGLANLDAVTGGARPGGSDVR